MNDRPGEERDETNPEVTEGDELIPDAEGVPTSEHVGVVAADEIDPAIQSPQPDRESPSVNDSPAGPSGLKVFGTVVGLFAAVAIGYGVSLGLFSFFADDLSLELGALIVDDQLTMELFGMLLLFVPLFAVPVLAVITGVVVTVSYQGPAFSAVGISAFGALVGFTLVAGTFVVFTSVIVGDAGGTATNTGALFGELSAFGIGVALAGGLSTVITATTDIWSE